MAGGLNFIPGYEYIMGILDKHDFVKTFFCRVRYTMGFFDWIGGKLTSAYNWAADKVTSAYNWVADKVSTVWTAAKDVATTVHQDARDLAAGVRDTAKDVRQSTENVINKNLDTIRGLGDNARGAVGDVSQGLSNLGWPLAIGAAGLGAIYFMTKK